MSDDFPMAHKVKRPFEWIPSSHHLTDEGRNKFWERQKRRMAEAAALASVTPIKRKTQSK